LQGDVQAERVPGDPVPTSHDSLLQRVGVSFGLWGWFALMLVVSATLLGRHLLALPRPAADEALARSMATLRTPNDAGRWMAVHVLDAECKCSQRIAEHLLASDRPKDVSEHVLLVGGDVALETQLTSRGFQVARVEPTELSDRYHIQAVPLLVVSAPDGTVRYAGGYTARKQGPDPRDLEILADARAGRSVEPIPVFGCAVARRLQSTINPLGLP
jgi:hypothetical protein